MSSRLITLLWQELRYQTLAGGAMFAHKAGMEYVSHITGLLRKALEQYACETTAIGSSHLTLLKQQIAQQVSDLSN